MSRQSILQYLGYTHGQTETDLGAVQGPDKTFNNKFGYCTSPECCYDGESEEVRLNRVWKVKAEKGQRRCYDCGGALSWSIRTPTEYKTGKRKELPYAGNEFDLYNRNYAQSTRRGRPKLRIETRKPGGGQLQVQEGGKLSKSRPKRKKHTRTKRKKR